MTQDITAFLCVLFLQLSKFEIANGKVLEATYQKWLQYKDDCVKMIESEEVTPGGLFCNRTFDGYACWPDTPADTMVNISCPFYLPWFNKVSQGVVRRRCDSNSFWERDDNGDVWRDKSQCEEEIEVTDHCAYCSLCCICIRGQSKGYDFDRKLHCTRNYIHANLFMSFILRAVSIIVKDKMVERHWGREIVKQSDVSEMLSHQAAIGCRIAQVMMQYCVLANHHWFFGEALYLYSVLITSVFSDNNKYYHYICLGWGTPLLFVIPWSAMKLLKENKECWAFNDNMNYWWIIRFPILFASLINFIIFLKVIKVIFSKLRASNQRGYPCYKLRLAKATLTLIPLFGIHELIFIFATDEQTTGMLRYIKLFFTLFLNSFQGFIVAVLYCYANKEVRAELKRKLQSWRTQAPMVCCGQ
uniref:Glucagon receptor n=1 Tax=Neogobius melanostomus TaxID=47308 RepID=A0A8C6SXR4_9GOBI